MEIEILLSLHLYKGFIMTSIKLAIAIIFAALSFNANADTIDDIQEVSGNVVSCVKTIVNNGNTRIEYYERIVEQKYEVSMEKVLQRLELVGVAKGSLEWKYLTAKHALINATKGAKHSIQNKFSKGDVETLDCE